MAVSSSLQCWLPNAVSDHSSTTAYEALASRSNLASIRMPAASGLPARDLPTLERAQGLLVVCAPVSDVQVKPKADGNHEFGDGRASCHLRTERQGVQVHLQPMATDALNACVQYPPRKVALLLCSQPANHNAKHDHLVRFPSIVPGLTHILPLPSLNRWGIEREPPPTPRARQECPSKGRKNQFILAEQRIFR